MTPEERAARLNKYLGDLLVNDLTLVAVEFQSAIREAEERVRREEREACAKIAESDEFVDYGLHSGQPIADAIRSRSRPDSTGTS